MCRPCWIAFTFIVFIGLSETQMCKPPGEACADTKQCCGGCCIENSCVDTYNDCIMVDDPCLDIYCPADSECHLIKPNCPGCEVQKECIYVKHADAEDSDHITHNHNSVPLERHTGHTNNSDTIVFNSNVILVLYMFIIIICANNMF